MLRLATSGKLPSGPRALYGLSPATDEIELHRTDARCAPASLESTEVRGPKPEAWQTTRPRQLAHSDQRLRGSCLFLGKLGDELPSFIRAKFNFVFYLLPRRLTE